MTEPVSWIVAATVLLAAIALAAVVYARRSGLQAAAIERQVIELRTQMAAEQRAQVERERDAAAQLAAQLTSQSEGVIRSIEGIAKLRSEEMAAGFRSTTAELQRGLGDVSGRLEVVADRIKALEVLSEQVSELRPLTGQLGALSGKLEGLESRLNKDAAVLNDDIASLSRAIAVLNKTPMQSLPGDFARLEDKTEADVLALAESIAVLRPLVPYPRWRYDADWNSPDVAFRLRQRIWQYFNDRRREMPFITPWHRASRVCIYLGNDQSRQILVAGCLDPNELAFIDRFLRPGMTFLDVGANDGLYTTLASKCVGPHGTVWAFEPSSRELSRLERNLELNHLTVRVFPLALADSNGPAELKVAPYGHEGLNTLGSFVHEIDPGGGEKVQLARLDDILEQNPLAHLDFIKLDVEGAELRALKGAVGALRRYRPVLLLEVSDAALRKQGGSAEDLNAFLQAQNYDLYMFDPSSGLPAKAVEGIYSENMIGVPAGVALPEAVYSPWPHK
ncbi:MAG TPA: FkbM family methyltransferase [Bryobacteraceae bacterium]|nr:FkbM family methyltransferase [Bryobacteraceae bacterium]